ncbi:uncharacterized protein LOC131819306 [Mustela lutreola]|uniref:uncharacterized protein LOC131819306 n=1 Tax=Mustela lutreola TaxID=9666 RepID=UPI002797371C|nr:uncharacterized protein LOC131819306 [Mustela lutreola]
MGEAGTPFQGSSRSLVRAPPAAELRRRLYAARCCPLLGTLRRPLSLRERLRVPRGLGGGRFGAMPPGIGCSGSALGLVGSRRGRLPSSAVGPRPRAFPAVPPSFPPRGGGWRSRCLRGLRRGVRPPPPRPGGFCWPLSSLGLRCSLVKQGRSEGLAKVPLRPGTRAFHCSGHLLSCFSNVVKVAELSLKLLVGRACLSRRAELSITEE